MNYRLVIGSIVRHAMSGAGAVIIYATKDGVLGLMLGGALIVAALVASYNNKLRLRR